MLGAMPLAPPLTAIDLAVRSGACVLLALIAGLLLRDYGRILTARLAAALSLSAAAYAASSAAGFQAATGPWGWPIAALAVGVNLLFWLFARALFDDEFRPRWRHAALWALIVACGLAEAVSESLGPARLAAALGALRSLQAIGFALAAGLQTIASWPADLVEPRRRLRVFVVAAILVHTLATAAAAVAARGLPGYPARLADVAALATIALMVAWSLLRVRGEGLLTAAAPATAEPAAAAPRLDAADRRVLAELERLLSVERLYRQDRLSIGALAHRLGLPEYRLRRLINQGLGARNFNAFLNRYRIEEAKAALADPAQAEVPVLTIALDAGFNSLGPFNRAFKADTSLTPSDYRRVRLAESEAADPARRVPKSA
jgi:AraC-like DNA-binding protein